MSAIDLFSANVHLVPLGDSSECRHVLQVEGIYRSLEGSLDKGDRLPSHRVDVRRIHLPALFIFLILSWLTSAHPHRHQHDTIDCLHLGASTGPRVHVRLARCLTPNAQFFGLTCFAFCWTGTVRRDGEYRVPGEPREVLRLDCTMGGGSQDRLGCPISHFRVLTRYCRSGEWRWLLEGLKMTRGARMNRDDT